MAIDPAAATQGLLEGIGLDGDSLAPMETDEPTATDPKAKSKLTPAMATRIKQIKPLLSGQSQIFTLLPVTLFSWFRTDNFTVWSWTQADSDQLRVDSEV